MQGRPRPRSLHRCLALSSLLLVALAGQAQENVRAPIVNGVLTGDFPAVGRLFIEGAQGLGACTGTLVGCSTILTAAHCVCDGDTAATCDASSTGAAFLPSGGAQPFAEVTVHPGFDFPRNDLAVVRLAGAFSGVAPMTVNETGPLASGQRVLAVGYGLSDGLLATSGGLKRAGLATLLGCPDEIRSSNLCALFEAPLGPAGEDSGICQGDSGGPLFVQLGGALRVAGVASGGTNDCRPTAVNIWARVFQHRAWIRSVAGGDLDRGRCGGGPQAGEAMAPVGSTAGSIAGGQRRDSTLQVPAGASRLRVALTHTGDVDADLRVRRGAAPTATAYDCQSIASPPFPDQCSLPDPAAGTWHVSVLGFSGAGQYQLTTTTFVEADTPVGPCVPDAETLCISDAPGDDRFAVSVSFRPPNEASRDGEAIPLATLGVGRGGLFTFFNPSNPEMLVKVLDGCPVNQRFWVFYAATTNVEFTIAVTDTETGRVWTRTNAQGNAAAPVQDTAAFPCS